MLLISRYDPASGLKEAFMQRHPHILSFDVGCNSESRKFVPQLWRGFSIGHNSFSDRRLILRVDINQASGELCQLIKVA